MDKLKKILSKDHDQVSGQGEPATANVNNPTGKSGLTGEGSHLASAKNSDVPQSSDSPIYDQFTHKTDNPTTTTTTTTTGTTTSTSRHDPFGTQGTIGGLQPEVSRSGATDDASTVGVKSGIMGHSHEKPATLPYRERNEQGDGMTDRAFPLAGGVTSGSQGLSSGNEDRQGVSSTNETGQGLPSGNESRQGLSSGNEGLQGLSSSTQDNHGWPEHEHHGHGHVFKGDPCEPGEHEKPHLIPGPHGTDTANRLDPQVHIPGAYPDPTPVEERGEMESTPQYGRDAGLTEAGAGATAGRVDDTDRNREPGTALSSDTREEPTSQHHYGRDAALVGGGAAGAGGLYEASKHHKDDGTPTSLSQQPLSQSQQPLSQSQQPYSQGQQPYSQSQQPLSQSQQPLSQQQEPTSKHHYGRDAALAGGGVAGAGGLYEASKHHKDDGTPTSLSQQPYSQGQQPYSQGQQPISQSQQPYPQTQQPLSQAQEPTSQHHYGRDAALVGGGAATAGGLYEANKRHHENDVPTQQTTRQTQEPHHKDEKPSKSHGITGLFSSKSKDPKEKEHKDQDYKESKDHHYGRDAGVAGAGAAGAGGLYEANRERQDTGPASKTLGPHESNVANVLDPRVQPEPSKMKGNKTQEQDQHHYGRDAAVAGGAGAAGVGAYEAGKHHGHGDEQRYDPNSRSGLGAQDQSNPEQHQLRHTGQLGAGDGAYEARKQHTGPDDTHQHSNTEETQKSGGLLSKLKPHKSDSNKAEEKAQGEDKHHYGRDAALAGGAGAAGAGAYEANKHHDQQVRHDDPNAFGRDTLHSSTEQGSNNSPMTSSTERHHDDLVMEGRPTAAQRAIEQHRQAAAIAHQPYQSAVRDGPGSSPRSSTEHHGRDAALAGGTVGAGGLAAHEYGQHRNTQPSAGNNEQRYDPSATGSHDLNQQQHHYGRDAAAVGGVGALGAHEASKHHHGKDSQNQYPTQTQTQPQSTQQHHYGRDAAAVSGAGALGAHEVSKHHHGKESRTQDLTQTQLQSTQQQHHYGRDAAAVGGAGALGAHEASKHHHGKESRTQDPALTQPQSAQQQHHYGRDAAAVGGAGALGAHEASKHHHGDESRTHERQLQSTDGGPGAGGIGATTGVIHGRPTERHSAEHEHGHHHEKEEKKGGLFGFLHRDKKDKGHTEHDEGRRSGEYGNKRSGEYAAGAGVGAGGIGAGAYEAEKGGRNKLHKDPPAGYQQQHGLAGEHVGTDGPIGRSGLVGDENTGMHPGYSNDQSQGGVITEPHTGLPMNVGKYGDGHGGTDANENIPGVQGHQGAEHQANWDAIRKANTPY